MNIADILTRLIKWVNNIGQPKVVTTFKTNETISAIKVKQPELIQDNLWGIKEEGPKYMQSDFAEKVHMNPGLFNRINEMANPYTNKLDTNTFEIVTGATQALKDVGISKTLGDSSTSSHYIITDNLLQGGDNITPVNLNTVNQHLRKKGNQPPNRKTI
jgi:hypothetical protein